MAYCTWIQSRYNTVYSTLYVYSTRVTISQTGEALRLTGMLGLIRW